MHTIWRLFWAVGLPAALFTMAGPIQAALLVEVESVAVLSPGSGTLDILLTNTSDSAVPLAGFNLALLFSGEPGVTLTVVGRGPLDTYAFGTEGYVDYVDQTDILPGTEFVVSDDSFIFPGGAENIEPAEVVRLARINFAVGSNVEGGFRALTVEQSFSAFSDPESSVGIPFEVIDGGIAVAANQVPDVVPEPGTIAMFLSGMSLMAVGATRKRRLKSLKAQE